MTSMQVVLAQAPLLQALALDVELGHVVVAQRPEGRREVLHADPVGVLALGELEHPVVDEGQCRRPARRRRRSAPPRGSRGRRSCHRAPAVHVEEFFHVGHVVPSSVAEGHQTVGLDTHFDQLAEARDPEALRRCCWRPCPGARPRSRRAGRGVGPRRCRRRGRRRGPWRAPSSSSGCGARPAAARCRRVATLTPSW